MIRAKRPQYNVQHNRSVDVEVEVELSPETLAAAGAAVCLSILVLRWLADISSAWSIKRQPDDQGVDVELPPCRDPFGDAIGDADTAPGVLLGHRAVLGRCLSSQLLPPDRSQLPGSARGGRELSHPSVPGAADLVADGRAGRHYRSDVCLVRAGTAPRSASTPDADGDAAATEEALPD